MGNASKYHRKDENIHSVECGTGDGSLGCSSLKRRRSHKAGGLLVKERGWSHIYWEEFR
jgi:hypothetical protein